MQGLIKELPEQVALSMTIIPTTLMFSFDDGVKSKDQLAKLILERIGKLERDQWFIGSVKIADKVESYKPFTSDNIKDSQLKWNSVLKDSIYSFQSVSIYVIGDFPTRETESLDVVATLDMLNEENDSTIVRDYGIRGRKIALNFAITNETIIDPDTLLQYFCPDYFMVKITPMHATAACCDNNMETPNGYTEYTPCKEHEAALKAVGRQFPF